MAPPPSSGHPGVPDAGQRHAGDDDRAAHDLAGPDRLAQEDGRQDDRHRRDQRLERRDRGSGPASRIAVEDDDVGDAGREQCPSRGWRARPREPAARRRPTAPSASSWTIPIGARTQRARDRRPGRRHAAASGGAGPAPPNARVRRPAQRRRRASGRSPTSEPPRSRPDAGRDDDDDPDERQHRPGELQRRQRVGRRSATASTAVKTGVAAMSSAESPAGIDCRPAVHRIW